MTTETTLPARPTMNAAALQKLLIKWDVNQSQFARAFGYNARSVRAWVAGEAEIPHALVLLIFVMEQRDITISDLHDMIERAAK